MGKNKLSKKKGRPQNVPKRNKQPGDASKKKSPTYTVDQLLDKVEDYIDTYEYQLAQKFCQRALELEPDNVRALETCGTLLLETGNMENAKHCFGRAIEVEPDTGFSKYMYMGQLMTGEHAVNCFMKGIDLMKKEIENQPTETTEAAATASPVEEDEEDKVTAKDVSSAYCSAAEIYLTDECFADIAEDKCKECLENALKEDSTNAEAHHLMGSYWLSKGNTQEAKSSLEKGLSLWLPAWKDAVDQSDGMASDILQLCPLPYQTRLNVSKILIELEDFDNASEILELLLDEEDDIVQTWYLLGWLNYLQGDDYKSNARFYLEKAQKVAVQTKCEDKDMTKHIDELMSELPPVTEEEEEEEDDENEDEEMEDGEDDEVEENGENGENSMEH